MSELIQKLLDIGGCDGETEWARGYDDGVNAAINVVEEYLDQSTLNENQQIVLEWLKKEYAERNLFPTEVAWLLFENVGNGYFEPEEERAFENLNKLQEAQVLQEFASWVEQEED